MAARERRMNVDDVLRELLGDDGQSSDSDVGESGGEEEVEDVLRNVNLVREVPMEQWANDRELPSDVEGGWGRVDCVPLLMPFTGASGLTCEIGDNPQPIDFFNILFDDNMWLEMTTQTNLYAENKIATTNLKPHSRLQKWKPVSVDEMKVFISLVMVMGITRKSDISDYWSTNGIINTPFFGKNMAKDRFLLILANLHLADNTMAPNVGEPHYDRLYKIRPFMTMVRNNFMKYQPERDLSFDEGTCPFKGRVHFRVYNPMKPNKFGIKLYQVCEASSGYTVGFDVYHGDTDCIQYVEALETVDEDTGAISDNYNHLTVTSKIVIGMLAQTGLLSKGHHIYMDNYYNSPELFEELDLLNTYACGTVRINRKEVPKALAVKKLKQGDGLFRRRGNLLALKFHDKRDIHVLSTIHEATLAVTDKIDRRTNEPIMKPLAIVDYIKRMGGVDLSDQIVQYYDVLRKCVKWWKKLFLHLFNLMLVNAYALYRKYGVNLKKKSHLEFRLAVVSSLLESATDAPKPSRGGRKQDNIERLTGRHFPGFIPPKEGAKRQKPMRDCVVCNVAKKDRAGRKRKQTAFQCSQCELPMCVPLCFQRYHTLKKYKIRPQGDNADPQASDSSDSE